VLGNLPEETKNKAVELKYLAVENVRTTRRYLKMIDPAVDIDSITFFEWDKHALPSGPELDRYLKPALEGHDMGILSEAGCPGIADPGQLIVAAAHRQGIRVIPLTGPNSIFLALMASGMNGQNFRFHGYLPIEDADKKKYVQYIERESIQRKETQMFMETPYRNNKLFPVLLRSLQPCTLLCVAANISSPNEFIRTKSVQAWTKEIPDLHKQPAIFLILGEA
jgi:16S rRNA (cytidine1402-2'-O)-methyltransferase